MNDINAALKEYIQKRLSNFLMDQQAEVFAEFDKMIAHQARVHGLHQDEIILLLACWFNKQEGIMKLSATLIEGMSEDLQKETRRYLREVKDRDTTVGDIARHFAEWKKLQIMLKIRGQGQLNKMVNNFEAEYKPAHPLDIECYKRGILDVLKIIEEE